MSLRTTTGDEMKMKILFAMVIALGMASSFIPGAIAQAYPCPISGHIVSSNQYVGGLTVRLSSEAYPVNEYYTSLDNGDWAFDIGHLVRCEKGQSYNLEITECSSNSACVKTIAIERDVTKDITFDLTSVDLTKYGVGVAPAPEPEPVITCEQQGYINPANCLVETVYKVCATNKQLEFGEELTLPECDVYVKAPDKPDISSYAAEAVVAIMVSLSVGAGVGFKITKFGTKTHFHPGRRDYHSPDILHENPYRHKKGETHPKYEQDANGRWRYAG